MHDLRELMFQTQHAIECHHRSCLVCLHYVIMDKGKFVRCVRHQRVWEFADRLCSNHEEKCLRRGRNCDMFNAEESEKPWKRLNHL